VARYPTDAELAAAVEKILAAVHDLLTFVYGLSNEEWTKFKSTEDRRRADMNEQAERDLMNKGKRAALRLHARRSLGRGERITPEMADAIYWDEDKNEPITQTRAEQAMMLVFGKVLP
jgi:hypothetical protein